MRNGRNREAEHAEPGVGTDDGVRVGHIVLSEQGLVGRVSQVGTNYAKVLLITDPSSTLSALSILVCIFFASGM